MTSRATTIMRSAAPSPAATAVMRQSHQERSSSAERCRPSKHPSPVARACSRAASATARCPSSQRSGHSVVAFPCGLLRPKPRWPAALTANTRPADDSTATPSPLDSSNCSRKCSDSRSSLSRRRRIPNSTDASQPRPPRSASWMPPPASTTVRIVRTSSARQKPRTALAMKIESAMPRPAKILFSVRGFILRSSEADL